MADSAIINIAEFLSYRGLPFPLLPLPRISDQSGVTINFDTQTPTTKKQYGYTDLLGRPIFQPVKLDTLLLQNAVITISLQKNIVSTAVNGLNGTIKELVNTQDYKINIKGVFVNSTNEYPTYKLEELKKLFEKQTNLKIENEICQTFGIDYIVIESLNIPNTGKTNLLAYEISALSDFDYTLELE